jgi:endoglucanase
VKRSARRHRADVERPIRATTSRAAGLGKRRRELAVGGTALIMLVLVIQRAGPGSSAPSTSEQLARSATVRFLDGFMDADGRVVRHDQGADTVSEGQAYALLLAVAIGDRARFDRAWSWTRTHLQREDGLLAWRWANGSITDPNPASDADIDAAHALILAARRFGHPAYAKEGTRIARSVLAKETVEVAGQQLMLAGPWARKAPYVVNPSYFAPAAFSTLASATLDPRWTALGNSNVELVQRLTTQPPALPPDWAEFDDSGRIRPIASPTDRAGRPRYGFDAARLLPRLAMDCGPTGRKLAQTAGQLVPRRDDRIVAVYDTRAKGVVDYEHPLGYVAAAAVAAAEGNRLASDRLLAHAERIDRTNPTYYGTAWVALGRVVLTTSLLDGCGAGGG